MKPLLTPPGPDAPAAHGTAANGTVVNGSVGVAATGTAISGAANGTAANTTVSGGTVANGIAETESPHARARAPKSVQILRLLLLAATAATAATWLWAWQGVQAYAWPGIDNGLTERGLAYLLILAPAVPVNVIAAIRLARGGRRARLYLAAAATLAAVQTMLLLTPSAMPLAEAMSDGSSNVGIRHLIAIGPLLFTGLWLATTAEARAWLGTADDARTTLVAIPNARNGLAAVLRPRSRLFGFDTGSRTRRLFGLEAAVWCLALAGALAMGTEVRQWAAAATEPLAAAGEYREPGTWAGLEQAVTETTDAIPGFPGFTTRTLDVQSCDYATPAGLPTYRYLLTYELRDSASEPSAADSIAARWTEGEFDLTYDGAALDGTRLITAERAFPTTDGAYPTATGVHAITLAYTEAAVPALHLESPCVERVADTVECILPQGDPATDTITGVVCRD